MRILICPLDWGLGHAGRCIPLIRALLANGHQVRVGAAGGGLRLLRSEFPGLDVFHFPGYRVRYSRSPAFFLPVMLAQLPRVLAGMFAESRRLRSILADHPCDLVISDGRYGVCPPRLPSVFITHQVFIRVPGRFPGAALAERLLLSLNLRLLRRFTRVWIPDFPGPDSLSGDLSHKPCALATLEFIGPLSRFPEPAESGESGNASLRGGEDPMAAPVIDILGMVSGPEPQRTLFEAKLRQELGRLEGTRVLVRGLPGTGAGEGAGLGSIRSGTLSEFPHLDGKDLSALCSAAGMIVARSGYTTVMELAALGCMAAVLVPTPGQSEQEYLADHLERAGAAIRMDQASLDLVSARKRLRGLPGFLRWKQPEAKTGSAPDGSLPPLREFLSKHPCLAGARSRKPPPHVHMPGQL